MLARLVNLLRRQGVALLALFIALGGTSFAVSARHGQRNGDDRRVILGCVGKNSGTLRVVESFTRCGRLETPVSFNRQGRRGPIGHRGRQGARGRTGATGAQGLGGPVGAPGPTGADGPAGRDTLTATAAEPAGANCAAGGAKLTSGIDADRNGTLAPGEVNDAATRYVCNGAKGDTGAKGDAGATGAAGQSVTAAPEPAGTNCANGGVRYTSVSGVNYVCNGGGGSDTAAQTLAKLLTVDGSGSGLDADTLDGIDSAALVRSSQFGELFDTALGGLFGTDDSAASNSSSDLGSHFLAEVYLTAASFPPNGSSFAAGQELAISSNTALFSLLGTTYGGNGRTTFALPDLRRQAPGGLHYVIQTSGVFPSRP
jgi:hypothetical protein